MQTTKLEMPREQARDLYRKYKAHLHYSTPMDVEIRRAYQLLAQGRLIIKAIESVRLAGLGDDGFPKLALCRADKVACRVNLSIDGSGTMDAEGYSRGWRDTPDNAVKITFPKGSFPGAKGRWGGRALLPPIPLHLRPKRGLANYHILWEAEWTRVPPRDPYLLRRIGKADMWLVVAMWDLTEVERAALAARMNG